MFGAPPTPLPALGGAAATRRRSPPPPARSTPARTSSAELTEEALERIAARSDELTAFVEVTADDARAEARAARRRAAAGRRRGPLHGIPVSVKDVIHVRGAADPRRLGARSRRTRRTTRSPSPAGATPAR